jgi:hypothetical protein
MKKAIHSVLIVLILILSFMVYQSIMKPIRFNKEKDTRYAAAIEKLKDIRKIQIAYKTKYGVFAENFDKLINFVKNDSFPVVRAIGSVPDSLTEEQALKAGIIERDTFYFSVLDSLFFAGFPIDSIKYVPYTQGDTFFIGAGEIETGSKIKVKVFEANVKNDILLNGMDRQLVVNFNDLRNKITGFPGLRVGSLTEASNNVGNWE